MKKFVTLFSIFICQNVRCVRFDMFLYILFEYHQEKSFFFVWFGFFGSFSLSISVSVSVCVYRDCCSAQPNTGAQTQSNETVYALHAMNILFASSLFFTTHNIRSAYCSMYNIILVFTFYVFSLCMRYYYNYYCCCCRRRRCCCVYAIFSLLCFVMFPHFPSRFPLLIYSVLFTARFKQNKYFQGISF